MEIHENIKRLRKERGLSQEELAHRVGYTDRSSIAKIEAGRVDLSQSKIAIFAQVLGTTPAELLGWEGDPAVYDAIHELNANHRKAAELLGWGVTITGEDLIFREVVGSRPANEQIALLTTLYQLNKRGETADKNIRTLRILAELVAVMDPEDQDRLVAFAEFTEAEGRKRRGLPPVHHQYQREE